MDPSTNIFLSTVPSNRAGEGHENLAMQGLLTHETFFLSIVVLPVRKENKFTDKVAGLQSYYNIFLI